MNEQHDSQAQSQGLTLSQVTNMVFTMCHVWYLPLELAMRRRFGTRYIDGWLLAAAFWPMMFAACIFPEYDMAWTWWAFWAVIVLGVWHRFAALWRDRKVQTEHTQFNGQSRLGSLFRLDEIRAKLLWEPVVLASLSIWTVAISPSLMLFLFGGIAAGVMKHGLMASYRHRESNDLRDARFEQEALAARMRDFR